MLRQTTLQLRAFLKPAQVHIEGERVVLTYDEKSSFHGKQIAKKWEVLLPVIVKVFGPVTLELITPEITKQVDLKERDAAGNYLSQTTVIEGARPTREKATPPEGIAFLGKLDPSERDLTADQVIGTDPGLAGCSNRDLMAGSVEWDTLVPDGKRQLFSVGSIVVWHHRRKPQPGDYELIRLPDDRYGIRIHKAPPLQMYVTANTEGTAEWSANLENAVRLGTLVQVRTNLI